MLAVIGCLVGLGLIELVEMVAEHDEKKYSRRTIAYHEGWGEDFE